VKSCPECRRIFPLDAGYCPVDGAELCRVSQAPPSSSSSDPRVGEVLASRYRVERVVADGGTGRVYEAYDLLACRNVAIKILHADRADDSTAVLRLRREHALNGQLSHEYVVRVFDLVTARDGCLALVMEYLYGEDLRHTLRRVGTLHPARLIRIVSQLGQALDDAHRRHLVHRDLKPDNVFLCQTAEGDVAKLLDFGSVKDRGARAKNLTVVGTTIGSPHYMAPEQAEGRATLDGRADVWSVAAIVYECLSGQLPFPGHSGPRILLDILTAEPSRLSENGCPGCLPIPPAVDEVMADAFKKDPARRIATVGQLADRLGRAYGLSGEHTRWSTVAERELAARLSSTSETVSARPSEPCEAPTPVRQFRPGWRSVVLLTLAIVLVAMVVAAMLGNLGWLLGGTSAFSLDWLCYGPDSSCRR